MNEPESIRIGAAYYPEQWPESRWDEDARLMKAAGIATVRLGEFAWSNFEPVEGRFEFEWLERSLDILERHGITAILGTPTPTYPAWLHRKFPDIHQLKSNGQIKEYGQRQDACKNHPGYREHALSITEKVTSHFGNHPNVIAWQTDNELGCHGTARCYCSNCEREFQEWLSRRFNGDIDRLNEAWGTAFWSQVYRSFAEISLPRDTADRVGSGGQNPGLSLDFFRFSSDVQVKFNRELASIIRKNCPGRLVTHNLMGGFTHINYFDLARDLDVVSWDNYPFFQPQTTHLPPAPLPHDLMRGLKQKNVWIMEEAAGPGGWDRFFPTPDPGRIRLWAFETIARGADFVSFFRWRSARFGTEQYWHGILPHDGRPERRYDEIARVASETEHLTPLLRGTQVRAEVAILFDYDSLWGLEIQPHSREGISYQKVASDYATAFSRLGVTSDVISIEDDFERYKLLVIPTQYISSRTFIEKISRYVRSGGTVVIGARSSVKDEESAIHEEALPAGLSELIGCHVAEYDSFAFASNEPVRVLGFDSGQEFPAEHLAELLQPDEKAQAILTYEGRYYSERAAAVRATTGDGASYYLGTFLSAEGLRSFLRPVLKETSIPFSAELDAAVEITARVGANGTTYRFYLNHSREPRTVNVIKDGTEVLTDHEIGGTVELKGLDIIVVEEA